MQNRIEERLYPELGAIPPHDRQRALDEARQGKFDLVEIIGLTVALAATVGLTKYTVADLTAFGRVAAIAANFLVAIPLLLILGGPFYFRRTRRNLQRIISRRDDPA